MTQANWSSGYLVEREYNYVLVPQMAPANLALAAIHRGVRAPKTSGFRYFELGCGFGMMTLLMAATHPDSEFWANDFMPSHVLDARTLAGEAKLENVQFFEDSFEELLSRDLPELDFIALHGVYSWVSAENRRHIVEFIRRRLKPGGLVYVSYNSSVGFAPIAPVRRLMGSYAASLGGPIESRIEKSFELFAELARADARFFRGVPELAKGLERMRRKKAAYLAHELFTGDWALFSHSDVAGELAAAKLGYVGSARMLDDLWPMILSADQIGLLKQIGDVDVQEDVKDFLVNTNLRRDVFARGVARISPSERQDALLATQIALLAPRRDCAYRAKILGGEVTLLEHVYAPLLDALARGPLTLAELVACPGVEPLGREAAINGALGLVAVGYAGATLPPEQAKLATASAARLNQAFARRAPHGRPLPCMAAPLLGSGIPAIEVHQLFIDAHLSRAKDPVAHAWELMRPAGQSVMRDGKFLEGADENLAELRSLAADYQEAFAPLMRQLLIVS